MGKMSQENISSWEKFIGNYKTQYSVRYMLYVLFSGILVNLSINLYFYCLLYLISDVKY